MENKTDEPGLFIETMARLHGINMSVEMKPQVQLHFDIAARMARALLEFPLDELEEPAPVFTP